MPRPLDSLAQQLRQFAREREWEPFHSPKNLAMALAGEAGELGRLEEGAHRVGLLDPILERLVGMSLQTKTQVNGGLQPLLHGFISTADHRLEGRNHVADHIFRRIVQECHLAFIGARFAQSSKNVFNNKAMLGHGKRMVAESLTVPARYAGKAMRDIGDLHIER